MTPLPPPMRTSYLEAPLVQPVALTCHTPLPARQLARLLPRAQDFPQGATVNFRIICQPGRARLILLTEHSLFLSGNPSPLAAVGVLTKCETLVEVIC